MVHTYFHLYMYYVYTLTKYTLTNLGILVLRRVAMSLHLEVQSPLDTLLSAVI